MLIKIIMVEGKRLTHDMITWRKEVHGKFRYGLQLIVQPRTMEISEQNTRVATDTIQWQCWILLTQKITSLLVTLLLENSHSVSLWQKVTSYSYFITPLLSIVEMTVIRFRVFQFLYLPF